MYQDLLRAIYNATLTTPVLREGIERASQSVQSMLRVQFLPHISPLLDQSQSLNIHMTDANPARVTSMHFYGWRKGLKTGMYYLRTKAAADAIQFTVEQKAVDETVDGLAVRADEATSLEEIACSLDTPDDCLSCGS